MTRTLLRTEFRLFAREPVGLLFGLVLPAAAFVVLACIPALRHPEPGLDGASFLAVYRPIIVLFSVLMLALNGLPPVLGAYRERGVLRRLRATPMPPARLLSALLVIHLAVAVAAAVVIVAVGALAAELPLPHQPAGWVLAYLLSAAAMLGLGVLVAAAAPTSKIANGVGALITFPLLFFAGLWMPRPTMPHLLGTISDYSPMGAAVRAMTAASDGRFPPLAALGVLAGYAVVFCLLAVRLFRWE